MRWSSLGAFALAIDAALAYLDTSPFFMFSTSKFPMSTSQLQSASSLTADVSLSLSRCPTDHYIVILQPDVLPTDFSTPSKVPVLSSKFKDDMNWSNFRLQAAASVSDVVGHIDVNSWREILEDSCGASTYIVDGEPATWQIWDAAKMQTPLVLGINLPSLAGLTGEARDKALRNHDLILGELLKMTSNYTVLYTTSVEPVVQQPEDIESKQYEMETPLDLQHEAMHVELKRNLGESSLQRRANDTLPNGPLFERYQFFTPGIYMGFLVGFLLLSILYVAISGVASLQVTYAAFDKESGQLAGRKQQ